MDDDSLFHIVQRDDGKFELVRLARVTKVTSSKLVKVGKNDNDIERGRQYHRKYNCRCVKCQPALQQYLLPTVIRKENEEAPRISALKNYSRVRKIDSSGNVITNKPMLIHKKKDQTSTTVTSSMTIKTEPELDIVDDREEVQSRSQKFNIIEERLAPTGEHHVVLNNQSNKTKKQRAPFNNFHSDPKPLTVVNRHLLLMAKRSVKCNVCGMIFPKGDDQAKTLRTHFLQHKASAIKVARVYNDVKYRSNEFDEKTKRANDVESTTKKPIILNNALKYKSSELIKNVTVKTYLPQTRGMVNRGNVQFRLDPEPIHDKFVISASSSSTLRQRKLINIKPISWNLLDQLRSNKADLGGKSHFMVGNTVIKPVKLANSTKPAGEPLITDSHMETAETKRSDGAGVSDEDDDDIVIVEEKPELIVIDDNEEIDHHDKDGTPGVPQ